MINRSLKPCPFCGNEVQIMSYIQNVYYDRLEINCPRCGTITISNGHRDISQERSCSINTWNSRKYNVMDINDADDWCE